MPATANEPPTTAQRPRLTAVAVAGTVAAVAGALGAVLGLLPKDATSMPSPVVIELTERERRAVDTRQADDWPGGPGYTAVLGSFATEERARAFGREASARGLDAGVLRSDDFRSLRPGLWVVFSGTYGTSAGAEQRAARAEELGLDAYPRFVSP